MISSSKLPAITNEAKKLLRVALLGVPNAGKSTLLNRFVGYRVSCVSGKVHTTRVNTLGYLTKDNTQIEFYDTPGIITKEHMMKHRLENSLLHDPKEAGKNCDLLAVMVDVSNERYANKLHRCILSTLNQHADKKSILILNKVDLVGNKHKVQDIGVRLSQGCIEGRCNFSARDLRTLGYSELKKLNLLGHVRDRFKPRDNPVRKKHRFVIELDGNEENVDPIYQAPELVDPDSIGYKNFSHIFSISALKNKGIDDVTDYLFTQAKPVEAWPFGPDFLTTQSTADLVHGIIRGQVMDCVQGHVPYLLDYKYYQCEYDNLGSMHVNLTIYTPKRYMVPLVIGERGSIIYKIIENSRQAISETLRCETKLVINVEESSRS